MTIICKASIPVERNILNEKNDCTVRALSAALEIPYLTAYGMMLGAGRKKRKGHYSAQAYKQFGFAVQPRPNMTVANYVRFICHTGNWIIQIRGHVFAVVNGQVIDANPAGNLNRYVIQSWKVK